MKRDYYVLNGDKIERRNNTIRLLYPDTFKDIPVEKVNSLYIFNEMSFNTKFINFSNQHGITLHFFNYYGFYTGSFYPKESLVSGEMLVKQVENSIDKDKRLIIAKKILIGASHNIHRNLRYYKERGKNIDLKTITILINRLERAKTIQELMGVEGNLRRNYYQNWDEILNNKFRFEKRTRMLPENIVNVLISFINTLLYTVCISEIYKTHLNPTVSFLHNNGTSRFSLALDISEIFKPIIVDRMIFSLLNKCIINENMFIKDSQGLFLNEKGRRIILENFDNRLKTTIKHSVLKRNVSYRQLIRLELIKIEKYIMFNEVYEPFKLSW